jgi:putative solute:sodium symporter small subunit
MSAAGHGEGPRDKARALWRLNLRWIAALLSIWFVVTFVVSWYARELRFDFFGWPFSFWAGAQGVVIVYVIMAVLYAWRMNRADDEAAAARAEERDAA